MTGLSGFTFTSVTGANVQFTPTIPSSAASRPAASAADALLRVAHGGREHRRLARERALDEEAAEGKRSELRLDGILRARVRHEQLGDLVFEGGPLEARGDVRHPLTQINGPRLGRYRRGEAAATYRASTRVVRTYESRFKGDGNDGRSPTGRVRRRAAHAAARR